MDAKCKCNHCDQVLEFDHSHAGAVIICPSCGSETILFLPPAEIVHEPVSPAPPSSTLETEEVLFDGPSVKLSRTRLVIFGETIAVRNITSVKMERRNQGQGCLIFLLMTSAMFLLFALIMSSQGGIWFWALTSIVFLAVLCLKRADFVVRVVTAAGEIKGVPYAYRQRETARQLIEKINEAIARY